MISSNFSALFQDLFWSMQHSINNFPKKQLMTEQYLTGFYTKFKAISRLQGAKINCRLFKVFKEAWEPCLLQFSSFF